jgi:hypothetical protein
MYTFIKIGNGEATRQNALVENETRVWDIAG